MEKLTNLTINCDNNVANNILKAFGHKDTSKLVKKEITNKAGKKQTVYTKVDVKNFNHKKQKIHPLATKIQKVHERISDEGRIRGDSDKAIDKFEKENSKATDVVNKHAGKNNWKDVQDDYSFYGALHNYAIKNPKGAERLLHDLKNITNSKKKNAYEKEKKQDKELAKHWDKHFDSKGRNKSGRKNW